MADAIDDSRPIVAASLLKNARCPPRQPEVGARSDFGLADHPLLKSQLTTNY
jgi:hypothetical protein